MRRDTGWLALISTLAALLTWLMASSLDAGQARYVRLAAQLRDLSESEVAVQRNALRARAGLLRNYDPVVSTMAAAMAAAASLHEAAADGSALRVLAAGLLRATGRQEQEVERFKTDNALLQNSAAFFDELAGPIMSSAGASAMGERVGVHAAAILQVTHNATPGGEARVAAALTALSALAAEHPGSAQATDAMLLVRHGQLLSTLLTRVDARLRSLQNGSSEEQQAAVLAQLDADRSADEMRANRFRIALYAVALMLLASLWAFGIRLRGRARALRHRAETQRVVAGLSARLLGCSPADTDAILADAVALLGPAFEAERCYLIYPGEPMHCHSWTAPGHALYGPGWPAAVWDLGRDCPHHAGPVSALAPGRLRDALQAEGVTAWAGLALCHGSTRLGLLGLDRAGSPNNWPPGGPELLGLAGEVIASALRRQRLIQEQTELEQRLARARRLEAVGTFASGIAHNFNNVVGAILGHAEMAGESLHGTSQPAQHVREIRRAGERAQQLVAHILDYGRRGTTRRRPVHLTGLIEETVALLRPTTNAALRVESTSDRAASCVMGEPGQLQQVFVNLLRNAAQSTGSDGAITVRLGPATLTARMTVSHGELPAGRYVHAAITDTGTGIESGTLRHLFEPFFSTRPAGTGLGLATAWEIVRDHEGAFDVQSTVGQGATFTVWLPAAASTEPDLPPGRAGGRMVLLLNPDQPSRHRDEDMLAALGYEPVGRETLAAGHAALRDGADRYAAVLIDASLYRSGSAETALCGFGERCPVIVIISEEMTDPARRAPPNVSHVIARPIRPALLDATLSQLT